MLLASNVRHDADDVVLLEAEVKLQRSSVGTGLVVVARAGKEELTVEVDVIVLVERSDAHVW